MNSDIKPDFETPHECESFLFTDVAVHGCECGNVTVSGGESHEYVPIEKYDALLSTVKRLQEENEKLKSNHPIFNPNSDTKYDNIVEHNLELINENKILQEENEQLKAAVNVIHENFPDGVIEDQCGEDADIFFNVINKES